jgi:hypothetical protein
VTRIQPATWLSKPKDLDTNPVGTSHGSGWLRVTWRILAVSSSCSWQMDFLVDFKCTLAIVNAFIVCLGRVHDRILMDDTSAGDYTNSDMPVVSRYRSYLQVECFPAICAADGLKVDRGCQPQSQFTVYNQAPMPRASRSTLVGSMALITHPVYTRFIDYPAAVNAPRLRTWPA